MSDDIEVLHLRLSLQNKALTLITEAMELLENRVRVLEIAAGSEYEGE